MTGRGGPRVLDRLRPRIISMFDTIRVVGHQPYAPAAFTPGEIPGTHFQRQSRPQGTWFCRKEPWKKSPVTPAGIDPGNVQLVAHCLNHYATPGPTRCVFYITNEMQLTQRSLLLSALYMFRAVFPPIIRSL